MIDYVLIHVPVVALVGQWVRFVQVAYEIVLLYISDVEAHFLQLVVLEWLQSTKVATRMLLFGHPLSVSR